MPLGSVEVEVRANLDKLVGDFSRGKAQVAALSKDLTSAGRSGVLNLTRDMQAAGGQQKKFIDNMVTVNKWIQDVDAANQHSLATWNNASKTIENNAKAIRLVQRAANPAVASQRLVSAALRDVENQYRRGEITASALARSQQIAAPYISKTADEYQNLAARLVPLQAAQQRYASQIALINRAEKSGIATSAEANVQRAAAASALKKVATEAERSGFSLSGWARSTEHHLRAMRLLLSFVGADLALRLGEFAVKTLESTAAIKQQAEQLGLTTAELQEYRAIAGQVGMTTTEMDSAFQTLGKNIDDMRLGRLGPFSKLLQKLGVDIKDAAGNVRPTGAIFSDLIDKLRDVGDEAQRRGANLIAFGEAGEKMGELEARGSTGVEQLRAAVRQMGLVLSDEQIANADQTAKKLALLGQSLKIQFASTVVENAKAISQLADALVGLASITLTRVMGEVQDFMARIEQFAKLIHDLQNLGMSLDPTGRSKTGPSEFQMLNQGIGGYYYGQKPSTGLIGKVLRGLGIEGGGANPSITVKLPSARDAKTQPHGPNIKLDGLLSPKQKKGAQPKYDQFEADLLREKEQQLQLEREATGDLEEQNRIDHELIQLKLDEQIENIKKQVHSKQLTAAEGKKLEAEARITASMQEEAADRKMRIAVIEQQAQYDQEMEQLLTDGLQIARALARTDDERKKADLAILDSKQRQAVYELKKEIALAKEAKDETRVGQLTEELAKLRANQLKEIKQFDIEHLLPIDKFKNDLPRTSGEYSDQIHNMAFDLFNQKLQQAAQFAQDVGSAFGQFGAELAQLHNPLDALKNLVTNLAETFTKNFVEKPIEDWATQHLGVPLAKQGFGGELDKLAQKAGGTALTTQQMNAAMAIATQSLGALAAAATAAASSMAAGGVVSGAGGASGLLSLLGGIGKSFTGGGIDFTGVSTAGLGSALDFSSTLNAGSLFTGFARGGFTGHGRDDEIKGLVHANEYVFDADTTRSFMPALKMISDRTGNFGDLGGMMKGGKGRHGTSIQFGDFVFPSVTNAREARQSANQAANVVHRRISKLVRNGLGGS